MAPPEVVLRGIPALDDEAAFIKQLRDVVEGSLDKAADNDVHDFDMLEKGLHDDLAQFVYKKLKRRPMVLPVIVEV